jgi:hypothetical protein
MNHVTLWIQIALSRSPRFPEFVMPARIHASLSDFFVGVFVGMRDSGSASESSAKCTISPDSRRAESKGK